MSNALYHVTPIENWSSIQTQGLKPQIGPRAQRIDEPIEAVYLFPTLMDLEDALMNWLGDELPTGELAILEVVKDGLTLEKTVGYELVSRHPIPASAISLLRIEPADDE